MRAVSWVAVKASRLFLVLGGLCLLALAVALISYIFGEREFPAPFTDPPGEDADFGTYAWQVGTMVIGAYLLWRLCLALVLSAGDEHDVYRALGADEEWEEPHAVQAYAPRPVIAHCTACGVEFRLWDDALDHAEHVHGHDRTPEEARALLRRV